jgi:hypothetical protein
MTSPGRRTVILWRTAAAAALACLLFEVVWRPHAYPAASIVLFSGFTTLFFASTWIRRLYLHPAYPTVLVLAVNSVLFLDSWFRHSKATSFYGTLLFVFLIFAIPALWMTLRPSLTESAEESAAG